MWRGERQNCFKMSISTQNLFSVVLTCQSILSIWNVTLEWVQMFSHYTFTLSCKDFSCFKNLTSSSVQIVFVLSHAPLNFMFQLNASIKLLTSWEAVIETVPFGLCRVSGIFKLTFHYLTPVISAWEPESKHVRADGDRLKHGSSLYKLELLWHLVFQRNPPRPRSISVKDDVM